MKKVLFIIVALIIAVGLTSCGLSQEVKTEQQQVLEIAAICLVAADIL